MIFFFIFTLIFVCAENFDEDNLWFA